MRRLLRALLLVLVPLVAAAQEPCVVSEQGDSHRLVTGIDRTGGFVRLTTPEPRPLVAQPVAVRAYAGKRAAGDRFTQLTSSSGENFTYETPREGGFLLKAPGQADLMLAIVAEARNEFLVIEGKNGRVQDYVAIYKFDNVATRLLLECKRQRGL